jgi:tetratricopeptide (TPR) repeat protein
MGRIAGLAGPRIGSRKWRKAPYLVMLAGMAAVAAVFSLRAQSPTPSSPPRSVTVQPPAPAALRPEPAADRRGGPGPDRRGDSGLSVDHTRRGIEAARSGAVGEAVDAFKKALAANDRDAETWNNLGVALVRQGSWSEAIEAFRRAVKLAPGHAEAQRNLAVALDRRGRPAEAAPHYRAFMASAPPTHPDRDRARARLDDIEPRR